MLRTFVEFDAIAFNRTLSPRLSTGIFCRPKLAYCQGWGTGSARSLRGQPMSALRQKRTLCHMRSVGSANGLKAGSQPNGTCFCGTGRYKSSQQLLGTCGDSTGTDFREVIKD